MSITELIGGAIGSTLLALGGASILAWGIRRRSSDRLLLFFGIWCCMYGLRLVALQPFVRATLGGSLIGWQYLQVSLTYAINVPGGLFVEGLVGPGLLQSIRRMWQVQSAYAIGAIAADLALRPGAAMRLNNPLVLAMLIVAVVNLWFYRRTLGPLFTSPVVAGGALILACFVVNENLQRPIVPAINLEPVGVFIFAVCLGYGVVASVLSREAELHAVRRELDTARQIQLDLLPRSLPGIEHLNLAVRYLPMTAVAGDLYDFAVLGPSRLGILVADVTGHGIPAALVAAMVKVAFSAQSAHADDPAAVLTGMNRVLSRHMERTYVTAVYAVIDVRRQTISYSNAGHPPLLIRRAGSRIDASDQHGFMLGLMPDAAYAIGELDVHPGDCVLLFSDGVPETQNMQGAFLDQEGVVRWLASRASEGADHIADSLLQRLRDWRGGPTFEDDVTLVVAQFAES